MNQLEYIVDTPYPVMLRTYLRGKLGLTAHMVKRLKATENCILCNGKPIRVIDDVQHGDHITLRLCESPSFAGNPALSVPIILETPHLVIYNKPVDMPVHPSARHHDDTLGNAFAAQYPDCTFHALFRLDRNTSGLCAVAKTAYAANRMQGQFQKQYFALIPKGLADKGRVNAPIARMQESVITRCVRADGKQAVTDWEIICRGKNCDLAALTLHTGRTHQIRVHMAHIGFPLLGDDLYGGDCTLLSAHALHCGLLTFQDPDTGKTVICQAPLRREMCDILDASPQDVPLPYHFLLE